MSYQAPAISNAGLTVAAYADILADLLSTVQTIYGQSTYLGTDSAIYQLISAFAAKISDTNQCLTLIYNARSPQTAIGAALDSLIKLDGLVRNAAFPSTCVVTLTGTPGTVIAAGVIRDTSGILWDLPQGTTIGNGGTATATATCETPGPIAANVGTLTTIYNPTAGWTSVTNQSPAVVGEGVETDSALRARQALSTAIPSLTTLASTVASVAATSGVTRYNIVENPTGAVDSYGNPAHSLTAVVEGGTNLAVATAIYGKHGIGCYTNGTTAVAVTDTFTGSTFTVNFDRPTYVPIHVTMTVHGLTGYTSSVLTAIQTAIVNYLNGLQIGEAVTFSALYGVALAVMPSLLNPQFSIRSVTMGAEIPAPGTVTATPATAGGTLPAGTYYYKVTALDSAGETTPSAEVSAVTTGTTSSVALSWPAVTGATSYKIYRGTTAGGESVYYTATTNSYTDTDAASTAGTPPTANTSAVMGTSDVTLNFNQVSSGVTANVSITAV